MEFFLRAAGKPAKLGILPGTFNPPTRAHLALARAALFEVDEVLFVLPRRLPHKSYEGAGFEDRLRLLQAAAAGEPRHSIGASQGGLFIEIARECRRAYGDDTKLAFLCGSDAAHRIVSWDYGEPATLREMLDRFELLVAPREGDYRPPAGAESRIRPLALEGQFDRVSATEVRQRIARGEAWEHLVPEPTVDLVREIYLPLYSL
jgi:nicotinate-nucleotide adenylyltransferase